MLQMVFAGSMERGYWIADFCKIEKINLNTVEPGLKIEEQINAILKHGKQDYTIFDAAQYIDDAAELAEGIKKICAANNSKAIILASGYNTKSEVVFTLWLSGIRCFILSVAIADMRDELEKCLNGYYEANDIESVRESVKEREKEAEYINNIKMIGVAGACSRIGTTTFAIQIVKYLQFHGYRVAYIQMNSTKYVDMIKEWYDEEQVREDSEIGCVTYENVDHYYRLDKLSDVLKLGYDFYVYDYGTYFDTAFNRISFLEKDYKIFVCGSDPMELNATVDIVRSYFYDSVKYIFNFVGAGGRDDIADLMNNVKMEDCYLPEFVPDKYTLTDTESYSGLIPLEKKKSLEKVKSQKKRLFGRKK